MNYLYLTSGLLTGTEFVPIFHIHKQHTSISISTNRCENTGTDAARLGFHDIQPIYVPTNSMQPHQLSVLSRWIFLTVRKFLLNIFYMCKSLIIYYIYSTYFTGHDLCPIFWLLIFSLRITKALKEIGLKPHVFNIFSHLPCFFSFHGIFHWNLHTSFKKACNVNYV